MNKKLAHGYRVIGTMKNGLVNVFEYANEKVANSVIDTYKKYKRLGEVISVKKRRILARR